MKQCPFCQKTVQDNAHKCQFCGGWFTNDAESKQKVQDREEQVEKLVKGKKDKAGENLEEGTLCFSVSTKKMVVMSLLTFGIYEIYWFYRNWRAIHLQEGKKLSPFWRAFFSVFWCYSLFKRILDSAVNKGLKTRNSPGVLTLCYIILVIITSKAPDPFDLIGIFSFIPVICVNNAARFNNFAVDPQYQEKQKLTTGEILFVILGIIIWVLNIVYYVFPEPLA